MAELENFYEAIIKGVGEDPDTTRENETIGYIVTEAGLARLREFLSEVPAERIKTPLKAAEVPRLFTAETFCKVVIRAQRAAA